MDLVLRRNRRAWLKVRAWGGKRGRLGQPLLAGHCNHDILKIPFLVTFSPAWVLLNQPENKSDTTCGSTMAACLWLEMCTSRTEAYPQGYAPRRDGFVECGSPRVQLAMGDWAEILMWPPGLKQQRTSLDNHFHFTTNDSNLLGHSEH